MAIELAQQIKDNQRMHLGFTLPVFALASVMAPSPQMAATSFTAQTQNPNEQLIDILTANLAWLLKPLAQAVKDNQQPQKPRFEPCFNQLQQSSYQKQQNHSLPKLAINIFESIRKKKKAKVNFILDLNKALTFTANNYEPPKAKVFKNSPKLKPPEIVQKSGPYSVVKDLIETPTHIIIGQLMTHLQFKKDFYKFLISKKKTLKTNKCLYQARFADNSNVTPLICKVQVADYFIYLILDSRLSVSVIAKYFLEAIGRKINKLFTKLITNVHGNKKKGLGITKAIPVRINGISIKTDMEVSETKEYTIIVDNE
ncbi:hypothetical protein G9A89_018895 [Geosiphon pyriformis]|nr:hypothetical protein G9A89_018895 [Geosiphon pyriformis]